MDKNISMEELNRMMEIAKNPLSTEKDLYPLFEVTGKLNLLLADHKNSPPERLRLLSRKGSDSVKRRLIKNPSFPLGNEYITMVNIFPEDFLSIKDIELLPEKNPNKLIGLTSILEEENCPIEIVRYLSINGSDEQKELIYKLGLDPKGSLTKITGPHIFKKSYALALSELKSMAIDGLDEIIKNNLYSFLDQHRPFAIPKFSPQDRTSDLQRRGNLMGGYPFTNSNYPWPRTDGAGMPMQPVFQLVLNDISSVLEEKIGSGLLQVWGRMDPDKTTSDAASWDRLDKIFIRHIPEDQVGSLLNDDFPEFAPWESSECGDDECSPQAVFSDAPDEMKIGSTIQWISMGSMWRHPLKLNHDSDGDDYQIREEIFDKLSRLIVLPTNAPEIYAGGFGGQAGDFEDPTFYDEDSSIVIRAKIGHGEHFGILVKFNKDTQPIFSWVLRYY